MKSAPTATADSVFHVEQNVFAWQMIGQRTTSRWRFDFRSEPPLCFLDAANVTVEILETECQLVGVNAFGAATELQSLLLFRTSVQHQVF